MRTRIEIPKRAFGRKRSFLENVRQKSHNNRSYSKPKTLNSQDKVNNTEMEVIINLFPFLTPDSHYATKPFVFGCLCNNFALLSIVRATANPLWIVEPSVIKISGPQFPLAGLSILCIVVSTLCLRLRSWGYKILPLTVFSCSLHFISTAILLALVVPFFSKNPVALNVYERGGAGAAVTSLIASASACFFFLADILFFRHLSKECTVEQKKFELANLLFVCYIMFGGMIFSLVESWPYNKASEFCLMTLLTIGYGNTVPTTFHGRFVMMIYTTIGLFIAGFFILSAEDIIIQDTDNISLRPVPSTQSMQQYNSETDDHLDPNLINELPSIPVYKTNTNQSMRSTASEYNYASLYHETFTQKLWRGSRIAIWILSWWLGAGAVFAYFEGWPYFDGLYFAFVSMTGIGYGDFTVKTAVGIEAWWIFLFNSVSIIAFFISYAGKNMAKKVAERQLALQRKRMERRRRQKRLIEEAMTSDADDSDLQQQNQFSIRSFKSFRRAGRGATAPSGLTTLMSSNPTISSNPNIV